jgi:hypothetical protein
LPQAPVIPFVKSLEYPMQAPGFSELVVQVSRDQELARLRGKVMGAAGFSVRSLLPEDIAPELQANYGDRVWVLCHTLETYEHAALAVTIRRKWPAARLLRLNGISHFDQAAGLFDYSLEASDTIDTLLRVIADLARRTAC